MMRILQFGFMSFLFFSFSIAQVDWSSNKKAIESSIKKHEKALIKISDEIWSNAELALEEHKSSKILSDYAEKNGMNVERGVAGMPTAFIASYGKGRPELAFLVSLMQTQGYLKKNKPLKRR